MHEEDTIVCNLEFLTGFKKKKKKKREKKEEKRKKKE